MPTDDAPQLEPTGHEEAKLTPLREKIDVMDKQIIDLLNERAKVVIDIGKVKQTGQTPIYAPDREQKVLAQIRQYNQGPLPDSCVSAIWRELMSGSFALERPLRIGYLGPAGSFSHLAARQQFGASVDYDDAKSIQGVFEQIARDHVDLGIVPIENSIDGGITETLDSFFESTLHVCAEVLINIHHNLLSNCEPTQIQRIYSKPNGFSQCHHWLSQQLTAAQRIAVGSTSKAAQMAGQEEHAAAIGSSLAGEIYNLKTQFAHIEDHPNNMTRFFVIGKQSPQKTGMDKTAIMFTTAHQAGALTNVLNVFKDQGLNLTHIDKRPSKKQNWEYYFFIDFQGHQQDPHVASALEAARPHCLQLNVLGSFPQANQVL